MFHHKTPPFLSDIVPQQLFQVHNYNTRRANDTRSVVCRTSYYQRSFLPSTIQAWNMIPENVRLNPSKANLKSYLDQNILKSPIYFNSGNRRGQILHARLRLNCSSLNEHLFNRNLIASRLCSCGRIESVKHFLLECNKYSALRRETICTLNLNLTVHCLLYGDRFLTIQENENIFIVVQDYIIRSGRFGL